MAKGLCYGLSSYVILKDHNVGEKPKDMVILRA